MSTAVAVKDVPMKHLDSRTHSGSFCYSLDFMQKNKGNTRQEK